jgi:hypothetical protein
MFSEKKTWSDAAEYCKTQNGTLAASRNEGEQDFLETLNNKELFWVSGNSFADVGVFTWGDPYFEKVTFAGIWGGRSSIVYTVPHDPTGLESSKRMLQMAILNGHRAAYAWKIVDPEVVGTHSFICRKVACAAGKDWSDGICATRVAAAATESETSNGWIAGVIVGLIILIGGGVMFYGWFEQKAWWNDVITACQKDARSAVHPADGLLQNPRASTIGALPQLLGDGVDLGSLEANEPSAAATAEPRQNRQASNRLSAMGGTSQMPVPLPVFSKENGNVPVVVPGLPPLTGKPQTQWNHGHGEDGGRSTPSPSARLSVHNQQRPRTPPGLRQAPASVIEEHEEHVHAPDFARPKKSLAEIFKKSPIGGGLHSVVNNNKDRRPSEKSELPHIRAFGSTDSVVR